MMDHSGQESVAELPLWMPWAFLGIQILAGASIVFLIVWTMTVKRPGKFCVNYENHRPVDIVIYSRPYWNLFRKYYYKPCLNCEGIALPANGKRDWDAGKTWQY